MALQIHEGSPPTGSRILHAMQTKLHILMHKVLTYVEYRAVFGVFQNIDSPPPLHPASVSPRTKGGGVHSTLAGR
jgi:hypothetical protein